MIERERKYRLNAADVARLEGMLQRDGALERRETQDTVHYADVSGRRTGLNLRVRSVEGRQELTVKGPRLEAGASKVREEHTVGLSGDVGPLLDALGLGPTERYLKRTAIYAFEGALVALDDVEGIGWFCEIEASDEVTIEHIARRLGLSNEALEVRGYARLVRSRTDVRGEMH